METLKNSRKKTAILICFIDQVIAPANATGLGLII